MTSIPSTGFSPPRSLSSLAKTTPGTVFVGNLSFFCNETHLRELVSTFGDVREVEVVRSRNGNSLLYGFVDFANPVDGENAVQSLHRTLFMGRRIRYVLFCQIVFISIIFTKFHLHIECFGRKMKARIRWIRLRRAAPSMSVSLCIIWRRKWPRKFFMGCFRNMEKSMTLLSVGTIDIPNVTCSTGTPSLTIYEQGVQLLLCLRWIMLLSTAWNTIAVWADDPRLEIELMDHWVRAMRCAILLSSQRPDRLIMPHSHWLRRECSPLCTLRMRPFHLHSGLFHLILIEISIPPLVFRRDILLTREQIH